MADEPKPAFKPYGVPVFLPDAYSEGHTLTASEAIGLSRARLENISHGLRETIRELLEEQGYDFSGDAKPTEEMVAAVRPKVQELAEQANASYEFGVARTRGPRFGPVETRARLHANNAIDAMIEQKREAGEVASDYQMERKVRAQNVAAFAPQYMDLARKQIAEEAKTAQKGKALNLAV